MAYSLHFIRPMDFAIRRRDRQALGLALAVLVLAVGFCVFDGDGHHEDEHPRFDLCLGMLAVEMTLALVSRLPLTGRAGSDRRARILEFTPLVPAPPPKLTHL
jgi:hypothetical protein